VPRLHPFPLFPYTTTTCQRLFYRFLPSEIRDMVNKKRPDCLDGPNELEDIQNELPKIVEGHEETGDAIRRCVDVCGPFRNKKMKKKRISKLELEIKEEELEEEKPVDPIEEKKKELLREMSTIGMGQVAKIRKLLKRIEELNDQSFRQHLAAPMARHELMTLLAEQGIRLPLWVSPVGEHPPPLVGAIGANDAYKLVVGDYCAAFCEDMWILGEVHGIADNGRYEIRDVDDREKPFTILARRRVIPLPHYRADPERDSFAIFPKNAWILALYPQTTVFYKGIVEEPPIKTTDPYKVAFDDSTFHGGFSPPLEVPQRYVLSFREVAYKPRTDGKAEEPKVAKVTKVRELTKEELKAQRELERERKREERAEEKKTEKIRKKEAKKAERERIKKEKKEAKQKEREARWTERRKAKNLRAKERYARRKQEEKERKEAEERGEVVPKKEEVDADEQKDDAEDDEETREGEDAEDEEVEEEEEDEEEEE
ncbi:hypothetical protein PENTCL1PPCAC_29959, partial [Pristionchus entomophagus]